MKRLFSFLSLSLILLVPPPAWAGSPELFGLGARAAGLAGAYTSVADDVSALQYNPAGLGRFKDNSANVGFLYGTHNLTENGQRLDMNDELVYVLNFGYTLKGKMEGKLGFALSLLMPLTKVLHVRLYRPDESYFLLYDNQIELLHLRIGIGYRPWPFLAIGVSSLFLASMGGTMGSEVPFGAYDPTKRFIIYMDQDLPNKNFFNAGILLDIVEGVSVGLSYRDPYYLEVINRMEIATEILGERSIAPADINVFTRYTPRQISLGTSYKVERFLYSLDIVWMEYSKYEVPVATAEIEMSEVTTQPILLDTVVPNVYFSNVYVPRFGIEGWVNDWARLRAGYYYEKSPLDSTDYPLYDTDKHSISIGGGLSFVNPMEGLIKGRFNVDLSFQTIIFNKRRIIGNEVEGRVYSTFLDLTAMF